MHIPTPAVIGIGTGIVGFVGGTTLGAMSGKTRPESPRMAATSLTVGAAASGMFLFSQGMSKGMHTALAGMLGFQVGGAAGELFGAALVQPSH